MPNGPRRAHPSRDVEANVGHEPTVGPAEYEFHGDDIRTVRGEGPMLQAQGRLFNPHHLEAMNRVTGGHRRLVPTDADASDILMSSLKESTIPSGDLQSRVNKRGRELPGTELSTVNQGDINRPWEGSGMAGYYQGPAIPGIKHDKIAMDPGNPQATSTFAHEMGHRQHLRGMGTSDDLVTHPSGTNPDPLMEGVADAYEDRYAGPKAGQVAAMSHDIEQGNNKFDSYQFTGYSAGYAAAQMRGWDQSDRALYAASRAHGSETGEQAHYVPAAPHPYENTGGGTMRPTMDASLHHLLTTSEHARQAVQDVGLEETGEAAVRRHMDRTLLHQGQEVQGSLFDEVRGIKSGETLGYIPNLDNTGETNEDFDRYEAEYGKVAAKAAEGDLPWTQTMNRNQFNEPPRSADDLGKTLGVHRSKAQEKGFQ